MSKGTLSFPGLLETILRFKLRLFHASACSQWLVLQMQSVGIEWFLIPFQPFKPFDLICKCKGVTHVMTTR